MKKIIKVLLVVLLVVMAFKFISSGVIFWGILGFALPAGLKFISKYDWIPASLNLKDNAYRYSVLAAVAFAILRLFFGFSWFMFLVGSLIGIGISYYLVQKPAQN